MINMDSADETQIIAGCAGGQRTNMTFGVTARTVTAEIASVRISGLFGGHSGEDIDKGRANANKLMGRVLYEIMDNDVKLVKIHGGTKDNAIPRECEAIITVSDRYALEDKLKKLSEDIRRGLSDSDKHFSLELTIIGEKEVEYIDEDTARKIVFLMHTVSNGVFDMNHNVSGIVEWSRNLGVVNCDGKGAELVFSARSSFESRIDASEAELDDYARMLGASACHYNRYPGWRFAPVSDVRDAYIAAFESLFGLKPEVTVIHAGLECGFISEAVPDMDIISCGAVVRDLHSPDERLNKVSFERFFKVIKKFIEQ